MTDVINKLAEMIKENKDVVSVTIIKEEGSSPRGIGSMMLVDSNGLICGTIGGGAVEYKAIEDAKDFLIKNQSQVVSYPLETLNMTCGGAIEVFNQVYKSESKVIIIGAGHICEALIYFFKPLMYKLTILDNREAFANNNRFPDTNVICKDIDEGLEALTFDEYTNIIIVTHGHVHDETALRYVINQPHKYIGMIGSPNKIKSCFDTMLLDGYSKEKLSSVYTPIGLAIGGETPSEIALSIVSEIQCINKNGKTRHMKDVTNDN